jgi:hypothetical protein
MLSDTPDPAAAPPANTLPAAAWLAYEACHRNPPGKLAPLPSLPLNGLAPDSLREAQRSLRQQIQGRAAQA